MPPPVPVMSGSGVVQCQNPRCGKMFYLTPEEWIALDPVYGDSEGVVLRCPECELTYLYHSDSLVETEVPVAHIPTRMVPEAAA
jgi:uncharacterized C2H2 Zn-finger protein